ncbi:hemin uptake protein HemP [Nitrosomonas sp. Nm166]|uniref:hemin uptake protein HemP n=1 Tax=Nitrosomonas sp. Nm166 TaxID=1881054 RepID=UPI0008EB6F4E|nr:hemin uptake protein HemP [Nitrosomonas sp. Nm166]SFD91156.1 Hemin uptake protein HemP [Nitrosomonas sp. Nm166]
MDTAFFSQTSIRSLHQSKISDVKKPIDSDTLFKDSDVIFILHNGEQYSLRRTRNGKLILNK